MPLLIADYYPLIYSYSIVCLETYGFGSDQGNGSYDGLIGFVQRNECNTVFVFVPYDSAPNEPGIFVPCFIPSFSPFIYSAKIAGKERRLNILHLYTNFTPHTWIYWIVSLTICATLLVFMHRKKRYKIKFRVFRHFAKYFWDFFMGTIDLAPTVISKRLPANVLWTGIIIAIFYGFHMIFMSTLSADLTVKDPDKWINNLHDLLYDPEFKYVKPVIMSQLGMVQVLATKTIPGSNERVLYERIVENRNDSMITFDVSNAGNVLGLLTKIFQDAAGISMINL